MQELIDRIGSLEAYESNDVMTDSGFSTIGYQSIRISLHPEDDCFLYINLSINHQRLR